MNVIDLNIDGNDLARYNRMRESAGLFAHAECHDRVLALGERERMQHVALAIESIPGTAVGCEINQIAMYDFDAARMAFRPHRSLLLQHRCPGAVMPDIRYALRNGDATTTGGVLIATGESMTGIRSS
ncbi:hypothetical protein [Cupriavidus necator]